MSKWLDLNYRKITVNAYVSGLNAVKPINKKLKQMKWDADL